MQAAPSLSMSQQTFTVNQTVTATLNLTTGGVVGTYGVKLTLTKQGQAGISNVVQVDFAGDSVSIPISLTMPAQNITYDGANVEIWEVLSSPSGQYKGSTVFTKDFMLANPVQVTGGLAYTITGEKINDPNYGVNSNAIDLIRGLRDFGYGQIGQSYYVWRFFFTGNQQGNLSATAYIDNIQVGTYLLQYTGQQSTYGFALQATIFGNIPLGAHAFKVDYFFNSIKLDTSIKSIMVVGSNVAPNPTAVQIANATLGRYAGVQINSVWQAQVMAADAEASFAAAYQYASNQVLFVDYLTTPSYQQFYDVYSSSGQYLATLNNVQMNSFGIQPVAQLNWSTTG